MSTPISRDEIMPGDTIKVSYTSDGVFIERSGKVGKINLDALRAQEGGNLWHDSWDVPSRPVFDLLDRPKPPLPTEPGTVIMSDQPAELGTVTLILQDGKWWYLNGESFYHVNSVANRPWKLAKVVEA